MPKKKDNLIYFYGKKEELSAKQTPNNENYESRRVSKLNKITRSGNESKSVTPFVPRTKIIEDAEQAKLDIKKLSKEVNRTLSEYKGDQTLSAMKSSYSYLFTPVLLTINNKFFLEIFVFGKTYLKFNS